MRNKSQKDIDDQTYGRVFSRRKIHNNPIKPNKKKTIWGSLINIVQIIVAILTLGMVLFMVIDLYTSSKYFERTLENMREINKQTEVSINNIEDINKSLPEIEEDLDEIAKKSPIEIKLGFDIPITDIFALIEKGKYADISFNKIPKKTKKIRSGNTTKTEIIILNTGGYPLTSIRFKIWEDQMKGLINIRINRSKFDKDGYDCIIKEFGKENNKIRVKSHSRHQIC